MMEQAQALRLELGPLDSLVGFHLRMASAAMARDFAMSVAGLDLTQKQYAVLELVHANAGASQVDIAGTLGTDRATMMVVVDRLDARGLISRRRSRRDGRRQEMSLTPAGAALLEAARTRVVAHELRVLALLAGEDVEQLLAILRRISDAGARGRHLSTARL